MKRTADEVLSLLDEHGGRLHALLLRLTLRYDVAEDLMQELFCKLVESDRFAAATSPLGYAIRMATNLALDHRRGQRRDARIENDLQNPLALTSALGTSPLTDLVRQEELDQVLDAMSRIPDAGREILVLRYLQREDFQTIGRQIGKTPHQARALCHKAIARLRVLLDAQQTARSAVRRTSP